MEQLTGDDPRQIAGYEVRARIGAGGMGRVYLAFTAGGRPVALKVIRSELGDDPEFRNRFRQEVDAARRVSGLYTAQVLDADPDASPPWLVTAYVPGPSVQQAVSEHGPLPLDTVLLLTAGIAEALQAIHAAGLVHRDLKASNVLLAADGPRVIDFGIARAAEATNVTRTGLRVGSPPYMAPEQVAGLPVSPATDVFSLGSLAVYAASGQLPFGAADDQVMLFRVMNQPPDLAGCPQPLRTLAERCLAKAPADRPSPGEIIRECRAGMAGQTLQVAQSWLPAALSADLAQHAQRVPSAQRTLTVAADLPTPPTPFIPAGGPAWSAPVQAAGYPQAPGATYPQAPGTAYPPGGMAFPAPQGGTLPMPSVAIPPLPNAAPPAGPRRRIPPWFLVAALAVVAAAGATAAITASLSAGGGHSTADGTRSTKSATSETATSARANSTDPRPSPSGPAPNSAACVTGTWRAVDQQIIVNINNQNVVFTGAGSVDTYRANGTISTVFKNEVFRANINGVPWTEVITGTSTGHWAVSTSGEISYSSTNSNGTETLYDDGVLDNSGPLEETPGSNPFSCSGVAMSESFPTGGSDQMTRVSG
jgi:hypothetical protein